MSTSSPAFNSFFDLMSVLPCPCDQSFKRPSGLTPFPARPGSSASSTVRPASFLPLCTTERLKAAVARTELAEGAVEPVSRESVAKFILSFYPSWCVVPFLRRGRAWSC